MDCSSKPAASCLSSSVLVTRRLLSSCTLAWLSVKTRSPCYPPRESDEPTVGFNISGVRMTVVSYHALCLNIVRFGFSLREREGHDDLVGFGTWKTQSCLKGTVNCDSSVTGLYCCQPPFIPIGGTYRNKVSWASLQAGRLRASTSGPGFISNIVFLVVLMPGQAWEPLLTAIFQMRPLRLEQCLL